MECLSLRAALIAGLLLCILCTMPSTPKADVIAPRPRHAKDGGVSLSMEPLLSIERSVGARGSLMIWGGGGLLAELRNPVVGHAGAEIALEGRIYGDNNRDLRGIFAGVYAGPGVVSEIGDNGHHHADAFTAGVKMGVKIPLWGPQWAGLVPCGAIEPYASLAYSSYSWDDDDEISDDDPKHVVWLNLGLRAVLGF